MGGSLPDTFWDAWQGLGRAGAATQGDDRYGSAVRVGAIPCGRPLASLSIHIIRGIHYGTFACGYPGRWQRHALMAPQYTEFPQAISTSAYWQELDSRIVIPGYSTDHARTCLGRDGPRYDRAGTRAPAFITSIAYPGRASGTQYSARHWLGRRHHRPPGLTGNHGVAGRRSLYHQYPGLQRCLAARL